jgi:hypothetical protein
MFVLNMVFVAVYDKAHSRVASSSLSSPPPPTMMPIPSLLPSLPPPPSLDQCHPPTFPALRHDPQWPQMSQADATGPNDDQRRLGPQ